MPYFLVRYATAGTGLRSRGEEYRTAQQERKAFRKALGPSLLVAGPVFENSRDEDAIASMMIIEAADKSEAAATASEDPYYKVGELDDFTVNEIAPTTFNNQFKL